MEGFTYTITGIPVIDSIISIVLKVMLGWFMIIVVKKSIKLYSDGNYPQLVVSGVVALIIIAIIIGNDKFIEMGKKFMDVIPTDGGTGGGTGPKL